MVEELENLILNSEDVAKALKIGRGLCEPLKGLLKSFLAANLDIHMETCGDVRYLSQSYLKARSYGKAWDTKAIVDVR